MKKQLLCTSAIALGVAAAPAAAQDWNLDWGGFYNTHVVHADSSGTGLIAGSDNDGIYVAGNSEIIFTPSITLDNGMTFGINVQLEAQNQRSYTAAAPAGPGVNQNSSYIDESYVFISSDTLGRIEMGGENSAGYKLMVGAPSVGSFAIQSASVSAASPITHSFRQANGSVFTEVAGNNDVQRISYFTPDFNGLTVGISYAPGLAGNASNTGPFNRNAAGAVSDIFDIGVNYSGNFGAASVTVGARWGTSNRQNTGAFAGFSDPETWGIGFQVASNGFTFGAGYAENDNGNPTQSGDREGTSVGISYDLAGPWTIGLEGFMGERDFATATDEEYNAYKLSGSRQIGPGVSMDIYAISAEQKNIAGAAATNIDTTIIGTSLNLSF